MSPLETAIFFHDPWWVSLVKAALVLVLLLTWTIFNVWFERRVVGKMQHRLGPIMNGPLGLGQALGDGMKLLFKEDFRPANTDKIVYNLAPILTGVAAFTSWAVMPIAGEVNFFGVHTRLQVVDLPVGVLFVLAIASIGIYGIVLAGWASNDSYSLLGGLRSSAQMISYEAAMGLSLVAVFLWTGSMSTSEIVDAQAVPLRIFGFNTSFQSWYWLLLLPSFIIYAISMVGETNRAPFDLPECEQEIVSGYITEYTGFRYALYFLAEYINMATVSAVATTLFLGGYHAPWPLHHIAFLDSGYWGVLWFMLKVQSLIFVFVWLRGTLPRLKYDQFMGLGWKVLIPIAIVWIAVVATIKASLSFGWPRWVILVIAGLFLLAVVFFLFFGGKDKEETPRGAVDTSVPFDAFAGGYPVPPMPGQSLPELAGVVKSSAEPAPAFAAASTPSSGASAAKEA